MLVWSAVVLLSLCFCHTTLGASFQLIKSLKTFHAAEQYCVSHGGHLASIHSAQENQAVYNLCHAVGKNCWIGFEKRGSSYSWTDGSTSSYKNFISGINIDYIILMETETLIMDIREPDNWHGLEGCAVLKVDSHYHGQWSDQACDASYDHSYFVCKLQNIGGSQTGNVHSTQNHGSQSSASKLSIRGNHFMYNGHRIFLSGINKAWEQYAYDFGNNQFSNVRSKYNHVLQQIQQSGGNSVRIWVHIDGQSSPKFDGSGHVTATDNSGTLISDLRTLLHDARSHNVFVFLTLWNGAAKSNSHNRLDGLIKDTNKLQSYLNHALIPMVKALKNEPALGGWDIMNEPEGEMKPDIYSSDPCHDTRILHNSGAGWEGKLYTAQEIQRFVNWQADAIKRTDPTALVTVGAWSGRVNTDHFGYHNYYKDSCLVKSGGKQMGTLSFYQVHSYAWQGHFGSDSPFKILLKKHKFSDLGLNKPLVIGEYREKDGGGMSINQLYDYAYNNGYAGGWGWSQTDGNMANLMKGMQHVKNYHNQAQGGTVKISI